MLRVFGGMFFQHGGRNKVKEDWQEDSQIVKKFKLDN